MKPIKQEDSLGCGVACVAFYLNITYQDSLRLFKNGKRKVESTGFFCRDIVAVLEKEGLRYAYKYVKPRIRNKIYKQNAIIFIKKSKKYHNGHYLIRFEDKWMDPWINFPDENVKAGLRRRLPGKAIYVIFSE